MERKFLEELGLAKEVIDKVLDQNSSEIGTHKQTITTLTAERDGLRTQLGEANTQIQSYKDMDIDGVKKAADEWKIKYDTDTAALKAQLSAKDYEHSVSGQVSGIQFSSESAKKAFVADLTAAKLPLQDGKLLGFDDFKAKYEASDPGAFASSTPPPRVVLPTGGKAPAEITKEAFAKMGYRERITLKKEQPEIYEQMKE